MENNEYKESRDLDFSVFDDVSNHVHNEAQEANICEVPRNFAEREILKQWNRQCRRCG